MIKCMTAKLTWLQYGFTGQRLGVNWRLLRKNRQTVCIFLVIELLTTSHLQETEYATELRHTALPIAMAAILGH